MLYRILLVINLLFALALVISYLSVHISPGNFALPAFFGLAYPYLLLVNILFVLAWAVLHRWEVLISVVIIAAGFTHLSNYIRLAKPSGSLEGTFKVISYNVRLFNNFEKQPSVSKEKITAFLRDQDPDLICLQEFYALGSPEEVVDELISRLGGKYYSHLKVIGSGRNRYYGILTLSRFRIINKSDIIHPDSPSLSIYSDVLIGRDTFRIFNNHLQSFRLRRMEKSFLEELAGENEKENQNELLTISSSLRKGFIQRAAQANSVKEIISKSPYPVLVTGDFNDTPVSYSYRRIRKDLNDAFVRSGYGAGFTYKGNYPANRIDYILYDEKLESTRFDIIKLRYSDHYPVAAWFRKKDL